jgi:hypothetical protein
MVGYFAWNWCDGADFSYVYGRFDFRAKLVFFQTLPKYNISSSNVIPPIHTHVCSIFDDDCFFVDHIDEQCFDLLICCALYLYYV